MQLDAHSLFYRVKHLVNFIADVVFVSDFSVYLMCNSTNISLAQLFIYLYARQAKGLTPIFALAAFPSFRIFSEVLSLM